MNALEIRGAVKRRGDRVAVAKIDLCVEAGERVALLGHNGAGKTTLMRMILGITNIDAGTISIFGEAPGTQAARRMTAYLPESVAFHPALSGREQLCHFARLRGEPSSRADDLLARVGLDQDADRRIRTYSKGMCQRLGLAQALLGRPRLALLDEPTSGLDPVARWQFYELVDELAGAGGAVLLSSHALTEMEAKTDRIAILRAGQLVANDSIEALRRAAGLPVRLRITSQPDHVESLITTLGGRRLNGRAIELQCSEVDKVDSLAAVSSVREFIEDIDIIPAGLDELYRHFSVEEGDIT